MFKSYTSTSRLCLIFLSIYQSKRSYGRLPVRWRLKTSRNMTYVPYIPTSKGFINIVDQFDLEFKRLTELYFEWVLNYQYF